MSTRRDKQDNCPMVGGVHVHRHSPPSVHLVHRYAVFVSAACSGNGFEGTRAICVAYMSVMSEWMLGGPRARDVKNVRLTASAPVMMRVAAIGCIGSRPSMISGAQSAICL
jgi:hypothetical protein